MKPRTTRAVSLCKHDHTVFILPNCRLLRSDQRTTPIGGICRTLIRTFRQLCLLIIPVLPNLSSLIRPFTQEIPNLLNQYPARKGGKERWDLKANLLEF